MSRILVGTGDADLPLFAAAAFKNAQDVTGLGDLPSPQGIECRKYTFVFGFFWSWRRPCEQALRFAVFGVAFAEMGILKWIGAIIVERRPPEHGAVRHHAGSDVPNLLHVTTRASAGMGDNPQIAGIYKLNEFPALFKPLGISTDRIGRSVLVLFIAWLDMSLLFSRVVLACPQL